MSHFASHGLLLADINHPLVLSVGSQRAELKRSNSQPSERPHYCRPSLGHASSSKRALKAISSGFLQPVPTAPTFRISSPESTGACQSICLYHLLVLRIFSMNWEHSGYRNIPS